MKVLVFKTAALCRGVKRIRQTKLHYAVQNSQSQYCAGQHRMMSKGKHHNDGQRKLPDHSCQHSHNQDENSLALALSCSVPERVGIISHPSGRKWLSPSCRITAFFMPASASNMFRQVKARGS